MLNAVRSPAQCVGLGIVPLLLALQPFLGDPPQGDPSPWDSTQGGPPQRQERQETAPFPRAGRYLGQEYCLDCHENEHEAILQGHHRDIVQIEDLPGCETCHGPGQAHGDDEDNEPKLITIPRKLDAAAQQQFCGRCHGSQIAAHGGDPAGFIAAGKTCTDCHTVHEKTPEPPHEGLAFARRTDADGHAEPTGAEGCLSCHPVRNALLAQSPHRSLEAARDDKGCESCHGKGSLHAATGGLARLITRPDRARDGIETCRSCHEEVDAVEFHWRGKVKPLLGAGMTCTTCHRVHAPAPMPSVGDTVPAAGSPLPQAAAAIVREPLGGEPKLPPAPPPTTNRLCAHCHAPAFEVLPGTVHEGLGGPDTELAQGCGSCHAGAEAHARQGGKKELVQSLHGSSAKIQYATCTACHDREEALSHVRVGAHHRNEVSCLSCHSPAAPRGKVVEDAETRCSKCHQDVAAAFRQPNRHPVPEGQMHCSSCHEPHGSRRKFRDLKLREASCVKCHREYRGPYVFEHQASRSDGCVICHVPHGSSNRRMLQQATMRQNCLQCHADFPAFHDQTSGAVFTNCMNCHTEIHGSNHSRYFFR